MMLVRTLIRLVVFWLPMGLAIVAGRVARRHIDLTQPQMNMFGDARVTPWVMGTWVLGVVALVLACLLPPRPWRAGLVWLPVALVMLLAVSMVLGGVGVQGPAAGMVWLVVPPVVGSLVVEWVDRWYSRSIGRSGDPAPR